MARKEHPQSRGMQKKEPPTRAANKVAITLKKHIKLPKLPRFTRHEYEVDNDEEMPTVRMSIAQWQLGVPRNPYQKERRDTARDIRHLYKFVKEHATVRMGIYPDGRVCKIEGHSRGRLYYEHPELVDRLPKFLTVECVPVRDDAHAAERFNRIDNRKTSKNAADDVHGAFRLRSVPTESKFFQTANNIKTPLQYAYAVVVGSTAPEDMPMVKEIKPDRTAETDDYVLMFKEALAALDKIDVNQSLMKAPFITAFLLAYTKHGEDALPFFRRINAGTYGKKDGKKMCPIASIEYERDTSSLSARKSHMALVVKILGALDTFMESARFREADYQPKIAMQKIMTVDLKHYLLRDKAKRTGRTTDKKFTR
jgi:hypothetical protein